MPNPQQTLDLERVLRTIDAPAAVVILVGSNGEMETAAKGIDNDAAIFDVVFSVAAQLADEIFQNLPQEQQRDARLYLPTQEEARRMGILHMKRDGNGRYRP